MRSEANFENSTIRGPETPASRILSASASDKYSFFCGVATAARAGKTAKVKPRMNREPDRFAARIKSLTDLLSARGVRRCAEKACRSIDSDSRISHCEPHGKTVSCPHSA